MLRVILALFAVAALGALCVWLLPTGLTEDLVEIVIAIDLIILLFAVLIAFLQHIAPTNPDGTPKLKA